MFVSFEGTGNQMIVLEIIGNKWHVYNGPVIKGAPKRVVVTIELAEINGVGKLDAFIHVQGQDGASVLINTGLDFTEGLSFP